MNLFPQRPDKPVPKPLLLALVVSFLLHFCLLQINFSAVRPANLHGLSEGASIPILVTLQNPSPDGVPPSDDVPAKPSKDAVSTKTEALSESEKSIAPIDGAAPQTSSWQWGLAKPLQEKLLPVTATPEVLSKLPSYLPRSMLTTPPVMRSNPVFDVPKDRDNKKQKNGKLSLRLYINAQGETDRVEIIVSTSPSMLEEVAVAAFLPLIFYPGEIDGVAVGSQVVFEIDFDSVGRGASRSSDRAQWLDTETPSENIPEEIPSKSQQKPP